MRDSLWLWELMRCPQPRNMLVAKHPDPADGVDVMLCDLDAAALVGSIRTTAQKPGSSAFYAPEVAQWTIAHRDHQTARLSEHSDLVCDFALDVWSFGIIVFQLCAGRHLFAPDIANDEMVEPADHMRLSMWRCLPDDLLKVLFHQSESCSLQQKANAKHFMRLCLHGDPAQRPLMSALLSHPLLDGTSPIAESLVELRMKYHFFLSHTQVRAGVCRVLCWH